MAVTTNATALWIGAGVGGNCSIIQAYRGPGDRIQKCKMENQKKQKSTQRNIERKLFNNSGSYSGLWGRQIEKYARLAFDPSTRKFPTQLSDKLQNFKLLFQSFGRIGTHKMEPLQTFCANSF